MTDWLLRLGSTASPDQETQFALKGWEELNTSFNGGGGVERERGGEGLRERGWGKSPLPLDAMG